MATMMGFCWLLLGALCGGSFGLPSKYVRKDTPWENLWGPFFLFATIIIPITLGPVIVKDFFAVYGQAGWSAMLLPRISITLRAASMTAPSPALPKPRACQPNIPLQRIHSMILVFMK